MKAVAGVLLIALLAACEAAPDSDRQPTTASVEVIDADEAARLAVKVANEAATQAERDRLDAFLKSKD